MKLCLTLFFITRIIFIIYMNLIYRTGFVLKRDYSQELITETDIDKINFFEKVLLKFLTYFTSYDAIHFNYISYKGYTNDRIFAFFPFFPYLSRIFSYIFKIFSFKNQFTPYILTGFLFSNLLCLYNSYLLKNLIFQLTDSKTKSNIAVFLFLINPGSIFYMAVYSENLYFTLELLFIKLLIKDKNSFLDFINLSIILICLLMTRSNGIICLSFILIPIFQKLFESKNKDKIFNNSFNDNLKVILLFIKNNLFFIFKYLILTFIGIGTFIWMVRYRPYYVICKYINQEINKDEYYYQIYYDFCYHTSQNKVLNFYNYIQKEYWGVKFLNQYQKKKINIILQSFPINLIGFYIIYKSYQSFDFKVLFIKLNLYEFLFNKKTNGKNDINEKVFILGGLINFFVLYIIILSIAYIGISNRLYTGHPLLYYWIVNDVYDYINEGKNKKGFLILLNFITFSLFYCIIHVGSYNGE